MAGTTRRTNDELTVVVVHGAWADGSSWRKVVSALHAKDLHVIAAPIPLTSLQNDIAALDGVLDRTRGPVILAAHAYAGAVISGTRNERVRGLCFIAALTPQEGETVGEVFTREPPHPEAPKPVPDSRGLIWLPEESFAKAFAQNASREESAIFAATQRPLALKCIQETVSYAGWKHVPTWFLIAEEDRMINPKTQHFLAQRMQARTRVEAVDHTPIATAPAPVIEVILEAVAKVSD